MGCPRDWASKGAKLTQTNSAVQLHILSDDSAWEELRPQWDDLVQRSSCRQLFLSWEWQHAWWRAFGEGKELFLAVLRDKDGRLQGIAPLFIQTTLLDPALAMPEISVERPADQGEHCRTIHFVGGTEVSDYLDVLCPESQYESLWAMVFDALGAREDWDLIDLRCIPASSRTLKVVEGLAHGRSWQVQSALEDVCPVLELAASWDDYLGSSLSKKQRHELRRKIRRAEREARVDWTWANDPASLEQGLDAFFQLHRASHPDKEAFMDERMEGFFRSVAAATAERDWLRLSVLYFDSNPVASYLCFDFDKNRLVYNSGFDLSSYSELSPGIVLLGYLIADAIDHGLRRFDFLQGNERYKYDLGAQDTKVMRLLVRRGALP